ncbi:hypothetical protein QR680_011682 [Steinernema hermaphroditum]|uniref:Protein kinase domain-containing protein n=1 Tax=Steinernema hermaphroditum TaxID=289476 RepID=A0AA39I1M8_9BILA|nr:hypothetical protein QR680_011682 [Steinernema hermaphroditum]
MPAADDSNTRFKVLLLWVTFFVTCHVIAIYRCRQPRCKVLWPSVEASDRSALWHTFRALYADFVMGDHGHHRRECSPSKSSKSRKISKSSKSKSKSKSKYHEVESKSKMGGSLCLDLNEHLIPGTVITVQFLRVSVVDHLGSGGFGDLYLVKDDMDNKYAMKTEYKREGLSSRMKMEVKAYDQIMKYRSQNPEGVLHLISTFGSGAVGDMKFFVMTRVGTCVDKLIQKYEIKWNSALRLFTQMFDGIAELHKVGYIHRNIKPANYSIGLKPYERRIYLIDLGMSVLRVEDAKELPETSVYQFLGTLMYAPRASHMSKPQTAKDDLESWFYSCYDIMSPSEVPWAKETNRSVVYHLKEEFFKNPTEFFKGPTQFVEIVQIINRLQPCEVPDYKAIRKLLESAGTDEDVKVDDEDTPFDWELAENKVEEPDRKCLKTRKGHNKQK